MGFYPHFSESDIFWDTGLPDIPQNGAGECSILGRNGRHFVPE